MIDVVYPLPPEPKLVGMRELRSNFAGYVREVQAGASLAVTSHDEVVAILSPAHPPPRRQPGTLRGRIRMAPDFDTLPDDVLAAMEGDEG